MFVLLFLFSHLPSPLTPSRSGQASKKISKENVIRSQNDIRGVPTEGSFLFAGPSDYIAHYGDTKVRGAARGSAGMRCLNPRPPRLLTASLPPPNASVSLGHRWPRSGWSSRASAARP